MVAKVVWSNRFLENVTCDVKRQSRDESSRDRTYDGCGGSWRESPTGGDDGGLIERGRGLGTADLVVEGEGVDQDHELTIVLDVVERCRLVPGRRAAVADERATRQFD